MKINIPEKFEKKLTGDYKAYINNVVTAYSSIIQDNKLEFFGEFTDHGIEHIEDVLNTASSLIEPNALKLLNTKDIAVLVASVILHDVGMHISNEGLKTILHKDFDLYRINYFDNKTWIEEWQEFIYEAKRFNDDQLNNIFGDSKIEIDEPDLDNLNDNSRKLCGEFIRRHHPRLAHEIAFSGFPSKGDFTNIIPTSNIESEIIDLCGLVARSHGLNLRHSFDYLREKHMEAWKVPYDIKTIFLMVVLRISDYIQIHSERANPILVKTKRFSSPISQKEWEKHNAIKYINIKTEDPERIYVTAKPTNSLIFLELKSLFTDIQYEFDLSWAILGEVYGKDEELKELKIKYRRMTSNIDDVKKFENSVSYIPEKIRFDADPELLKLLIGPLYGEDPKYGIRELLQNSVDAVKERRYVDKVIESKIIIELIKGEEHNYFLSIKDNGIGMTKNTIINFFFRAGASFRNSMIWKKDFLKNSEVKIEKTGRFGVGVLAVFLLGEEFELRTKHYNDSNGYYCKASLSTKQIELLKEDCEIGTFLKIKLNEKNIKIFKTLIYQHKNIDQNNSFSYLRKDLTLDWFNWYFMNSPIIEYKIEAELKNIFNFKDVTISSKPEIPLKGWHSFSTDQFKSIHWTISGTKRSYFYDDDIDLLYCNGFKILRGYQIPNFPWKLPMISVFDGNAKMPLSLSRDYLLNDRLPFEEELIDNICLKVIKKLHDTEFKQVNGYWIAQENVLELLETKINLSEFIIVQGEAFTLMTPFIFKELNIKCFYQLWLKNSLENNSLFSDKETFYQASLLNNDPNYFYKNMLDPKSYDLNFLNKWFSLGEVKNREDLLCNNYILNDKLAYMLEKNRISKSFRDSYKSSLYNERWARVKSYKKIDDYYSEKDKEKKMILEKKIKQLKETSKIIKENLNYENYYFVKENYVSFDDLYSFEKFKEVWHNIYGKDDYLIPIDKRFRIKIN